MVRLLKVNVPLFEMPEVAADIVIVPPLGANVLVLFTVRVPATE